MVVLASVAALITLAFFFRRRVFARGCRRDDLFLARANASDDAAFALENGDEVRLVARRRADAGARTDSGSGGGGGGATKTTGGVVVTGARPSDEITRGPSGGIADAGAGGA